MATPRGEFPGTRGPGGGGHRNPAFGFHCPDCGSGRHKTVDSRQSGTCRLRTYQCLDCETRFRTLEVPGPIKTTNGTLAYESLRRELLDSMGLDDLIEALRRKAAGAP